MHEPFAGELEHRLLEGSDEMQLREHSGQQRGICRLPVGCRGDQYKKPSKPEGVPFWTHDGDVCYVEVLKSAVRLTFAKGARMQPNDLFNTRLDSKVVRAIDYSEGSHVDPAAVKALVAEAVELNIAAK